MEVTVVVLMGEANESIPNTVAAAAAAAADDDALVVEVTVWGVVTRCGSTLDRFDTSTRATLNFFAARLIVCIVATLLTRLVRSEAAFDSEDVVDCCCC